MKCFNHTRPVRDNHGNRTGERPAPASRITADELGGQFGPDKRRRLVVTLRAGDLIEFRPERTRQVVSMLAVDLYRVALRAVASRLHLEKARNSKAKKAAARVRRQIANQDRKFSKP